MADTTIVWDQVNSRGDWALSGSALKTGNDLQTAILISLFSDRVAQPDDVIPDGTDPRGWWADGDVLVGSRLWLLRRAKQTQETLQKAYDYIAESLQWLLDDQVVARFDITVEWYRPSFLGAWIIAYKTDGSVAYNGKFSWAWSGIN